jgi:7-cyano-7-deazaguanine reductase
MKSTNEHSNKLYELASKHLGKAGDGTIVKPYTTPDKHDNSLVVPLPRQLNRAKSGIKDSEFYGYEIWHAYEMSFLYNSGMPCTGVLRVRFGHDSENMVESKSFKLYLNSFDLEKFSSIEEVEDIIRQDLSAAAGGRVNVRLHEANSCNFRTPSFEGAFRNVDSLQVKIDKYTEDPTLLDDDMTGAEIITFHTANLRSNCEITNQKDTGNCYIYMRGKNLPTLEGLTRYIISFRDTQHFHENATEIIYQTLNQRYKPEAIVVMDIYNRRGGLDIHSVRGNSKEIVEKIAGSYDNVNYIFTKTSQQ